MKLTHEIVIPGQPYNALSLDIQVTGWSDGLHLIRDSTSDCVAIATDQIPEVIAALADIYEANSKETVNE